MILLVKTVSGTSYEIDNDNFRVRRIGDYAMRRDTEWLSIEKPVRPKKGQGMHMMLEPLATEAVATLRITTEVVSIEKVVVQ